VRLLERDAPKVSFCLNCLPHSKENDKNAFCKASRPRHLSTKSVNKIEKTVIKHNIFCAINLHNYFWRICVSLVV
jgi:hypothetical protein